jgi:outer membrane protein
MMRSTTSLCAGLLALLTFPVAQADAIGVYVSADYWQYDGKADVAQTGKQKSSFLFEQQNQASLSLRFEHPVPVLPNVRLRHTALKGNDTQKVTQLEFRGIQFQQNVNLDVDLTNTDLVLYYEVLDNIVSADVGIAAKLIQGDIVAKAKPLGIQKSTLSLNETIPMVYLSVGVQFPLTGLSVKSEVAGVSYSGSNLTDAQAEIQYNFIDNLVVDAGLKLGYRQITANLEDVDDTDASFEFKGPYVGLELHF